jgi:MerR family transcriptional regulator, light-induced transcriptional regulator
MNNIKNTFTIKDLENLTGIKAHTIRIWEKRYNILAPLRTDTNIRVYDAHSLQKLLNINTLNNFGYKISTISKVADEKLPQMVKEILSDKTQGGHVLSNFKLAMMNFDVQLFLSTYERVAKSKPFRDIFQDCFMQLLEEIGNLWQTGTITPAHEHFISNLIKQKIAVNTEALQSVDTRKTDRVFVLYLPEGEIHEIGLMLLNYELLLNGYKTVYLGESVPLADIREIKNTFDNITFVTYFTVEPAATELPDFIHKMKETIVNDGITELMIFGRNSDIITPLVAGTKIKSFSTIRQFTDHL